MGHKVLAQPCVCIPFEHDRGEHEPGCQVLLCTMTDGSDRVSQTLAKALIYNSHYNEDTDKTPEKSANTRIPANVSSHSPVSEHESSPQTVIIHNLATLS